MVTSLLVLALLQAQPPAATRPAESSPALHKLFDEYWQSYLRRHPVRATYLGDHRYDDRLDDLSEKARQADLAEMREFQRRVRAISAESLSEADRLNARLFDRIVSDQLELSDIPMHLIPIRQQDGPHIDLPMLLLSHPFDTARDYENYVSRLRAFGAQSEHVLARMKEGLKRGIVPPRIIMAKVLDQLSRQVVDDPAKSEFRKPAANWPTAIGESDRARLARAVDVAIMQDVVPSYRKLRDFVRDQYIPGCRDGEGICHLPGGKAWYARLARFHTTTDKTPDELHKLGLAELDRIHAEMRQIMSKVGFKGDLGAFEAHLRGRSDMHARSADDLMKRHAAILKKSDANLPRLFGRLPRTPYGLKEIEPFRAPEAPMAYYYEAPDSGDRPAYFYVNTYQPTQRPLYTMEALAYHEAMPGHHLQIALAKEARGLPDFRRHASFTVFVEGWGLYSESLGRELGGYADPYSDFGRLTFDAWRSCRLVVDTGLHHFGWSRGRAIEFMKANTSMTELDITAEVDRYIAWPGQALAYKVGQLAIRDMRRQAESRLGERFDIRAFHDHLLAEGALPLDVLEARMEAWAKAGFQARPR